MECLEAATFSCLALVGGTISTTVAYNVVDIFPISSESKHMAIVVCNTVSGEYSFLQKGMDVIMAKIMQHNDWLEEEMANMAREA